jgi:hypothetical protein
MAYELLKHGRIDHLIYIATMGHHLITYGQEVKEGKARACNYTERTIEEELERRARMPSNDPRQKVFEQERERLRPTA